jgi:hypothetical protein
MSERRVASTIISKIREIYHQEGIQGISSRIGRNLYSETDMYQIDLTQHPELMDRPVRNNLKMAEMTHETLQQMIREHGGELSEEKRVHLLQRLQEDSTDQVYLITDGDKIVGHYCNAYGDNYIKNMNYLVRKIPGNVYLFDDYTFIPHRNKGAQHFAVLSRLQLARVNGYTSATTLIRSDNVYSIKAYTKCGFIKCSEIVCINLLLTRKSIEKKRKP